MWILLKSLLGRQSFDQAENVFEAHRFGEHLGYIQISGPLPTRCREHDSGDAAEGRILQQRLQELPTIHHRHPQVKENGTRLWPRAKPVERLLPIGSGDDAIPSIRQHIYQRFADLVVIIHDHDERVIGLDRDRIGPANV